MATHKVTYETTDKPDAATLPPGARVEQISPYPAVATAHRRTLRVNRVKGCEGNAATVKITADTGESKGLPLTEDQARDIGETLVKAADEYAAERVKREKEAKMREFMAATVVAERRLTSTGYGDPFPYRF